MHSKFYNPMEEISVLYNHGNKREIILKSTTTELNFGYALQ